MKVVALWLISTVILTVGVVRNAGSAGARPLYSGPDESVEPILREDYFRFPGTSEVISTVVSPSDLDIGGFLEAYTLSEGFHESTGDLTEELVAMDIWMAPIYRTDIQPPVVLGVVSASEAAGPGSGQWVVNTVYEDVVLAGALENWQAGDRLLEYLGHGAFFRVTGTHLVGLNESAKYIFPSGGTLSDLQALTQIEAATAEAAPGIIGGGNAGASDPVTPSGAPSHWRLWSFALLGILAGGLVWCGKRRVS